MIVKSHIEGHADDHASPHLDSSHLDSSPAAPRTDLSAVAQSAADRGVPQHASGGQRRAEQRYSSLLLPAPPCSSLLLPAPLCSSLLLPAPPCSSQEED